MEIGKTYKIWYKDAQEVIRARTIRLLNQTEHMIEFLNLYNNKNEGISLKMLQRYEQVDRYEGSKNVKS